VRERRVSRGEDQSEMTEHAGLRELARTVAVEAAELVRARRAGHVEVAATKTSPLDIVTEVDTAAEALIRDRLLTARPDDGFLGEESSDSVRPVSSVEPADSAGGVTWVVDPIDGTVNFLYGIPYYAVSIAARLGGCVVAGVVVDVVTGDCYAATLGGGATRNGEPLRVRPAAPLSERMVLTGFSYSAEVRAHQATAVSRLATRVRDIRRLGSAALDLCAVGAGRADAYVEEGLQPWDLAAGGLVATEAGAVVRTVPGSGGTTAVLCAPADGFDEFMALAGRCGFLAEAR